MTFDKAMRVLLQGGKVMREDWKQYNGGRHYLTVREGKLCTVMHGGFIPSYTALSGDEILSSDWIEVR